MDFCALDSKHLGNGKGFSILRKCVIVYGISVNVGIEGALGIEFVSEFRLNYKSVFIIVSKRAYNRTVRILNTVFVVPTLAYNIKAIARNKGGVKGLIICGSFKEACVNIIDVGTKLAVVNGDLYRLAIVCKLISINT